MTTPSFIQRWSRRKLEAAISSAPEIAPSSQPLAPVESLEFGADFSAYMQAEVPAGQRTAALRKLFMTDHYRAMDGLDVYVGDYSRPLALDALLLGSLAHSAAVLAPPTAVESIDTPPQGPEQA